MTLSKRPPRLGWRRRREDAFPISVFRRDGGRVVHLEELHAHDFFTLLFVDKGRGTVRLLGRGIDLAPGDVHLLPPGEPHDTSELGRVSGWVLEFTADSLGGVSGDRVEFRLGNPLWRSFGGFNASAVGKVTLPADRLPRMANWFLELDRELRERAAGFQDAARALLRLILIDVSRLCSSSAGEDRAAGAHSALVAEVLGIIDQRFAEGISLVHVARAVGRSPSHVTHLVRTQTQLTVLEWITARRLDEARRRLRNSDEDISIVAERVGYGSADHFIRQFRKAHGMTPAAWRKALIVVKPAGRAGESDHR